MKEEDSVVESCRRLNVPVRKYLGRVLPGLANRFCRVVSVVCDRPRRAGRWPGGEARKKDAPRHKRSVASCIHCPRPARLSHRTGPCQENLPNDKAQPFHKKGLPCSHALGALHKVRVP